MSPLMYVFFVVSALVYIRLGYKAGMKAGARAEQLRVQKAFAEFAAQAADLRRALADARRDCN